MNRTLNKRLPDDLLRPLFHTSVWFYALVAALGSVVLAGPTASAWPRPFFERGVHVMGGIRVLDGRALLQVVSEGGSGYFFEGIAEKVCIVREGEALDIARRVAA